MKIALWLTAFAALLWPAIEAVAVNPVKLPPKLAQNHGNTDIAGSLVQKTNETKPSASFDSFRVSTPEQNGDGTLLLDSYHDFRSNHHHRPHHGHHYDHHYPHYSGTGEDSYHHRYPHYYGHHNNHGYHNYHNRHHRHLPYPSDDVGTDEIANTDEFTETTEPVNGDEITDSVSDNESNTAVNGELVDDPETEEQPETTDEPSEDVEEIPIEDVPGEPVNGEVVSGDLRYSKNYNNDEFSSYDRHHPIFSHLPPTHFKCSHVKHSGYSSDVEARCQVILPGNRSGKWEILHFLHKSSPQKSNAVIYLDHGGHRSGYHNYHHQPHYNNHYPHYYHSRYNHHSHHHRHHYNGHHYPRFDYIKRKK